MVPDEHPHMPPALHVMFVPHEMPAAIGLLHECVVALVDVHAPAEWHPSLAVHATGFPPTHAPLLSHVSVCVQPLLSLQGAPTAMGFEHVPLAGLQVPAE